MTQNHPENTVSVRKSAVAGSSTGSTVAEPEVVETVEAEETNELQEEASVNTAAPKRERKKAERKAAKAAEANGKGALKLKKSSKKSAGKKAAPTKKTGGKKSAKVAKAKGNEEKKDRKPREKKEGLRRFQVRTLKVLAASADPKTLADIAKKAGISVALVVQGVGRIEEEAREAYEAKAGFPSLLTLKYIRHDENPEGRAAAYSITASGRKALEKYTAEHGKTLPPVHVGPNGKSKE